MIKFLRLALRRLAAIAVRAWPRRPRRDKESAATASPPTISPETAVEQTAEPSGNVEIAVAPVEVSQQTNPVVAPEVASDSAAPTFSESLPVLPDSADTISSQPADTSPVNLQPETPTVTESLVSQAEQPAAPQIPVPTEPDVRAESSSVSPPTRTGKKEEKRRIAPEHRGGGKMETEEVSKPVERRERTRLLAHLRLVCFKDNYRMWQLAVELPEDVSAEVGVQAFQDSEALPRVGSDENRWLLKRLNGTIEAVENQGDGQRWQLEIPRDEYLLFKLLEDAETEEGRWVTAATRGDYLVIAPTDWPMPDSSGIQLSKEPNVAIDGHVGYRFNVLDGVHPRLEFRQRGGRRAAIQFRTAYFTLKGERADAVFGEYETPLFLKSPPSVRAPDAESWSQVQKIVLGVAGRGRHEPKKPIRPNPVNNEIQLVEHLSGKKGGWYFLRFYDADDVLLESPDFAFATTLRSVKVSGAPAMPAVGGHGAASLEFEHDADVVVEVYGEQRLEPQTSAGRTAFSVPASWEHVDWQLCSPDHSPLKCTTRIERVWWALGHEKQVPSDSEWTSKRVVAKREDFRASSDTAIWIRLPKPAWVEKLFVGFSRSSALSCRASSSKREIVIPLREFEGSEEFRGAGVASLACWLRCNGPETFVELARVEVVDRPVRREQRISTTEQIRSTIGATQLKRGQRKERLGRVVSSKMAKTIVVRVERRFPHPRFKKVVTSYSKFYAHDEKREAKVGDVVLIHETRPLSRLKRWRLIEIVKAASETTPPVA